MVLVANQLATYSDIGFSEYLERPVGQDGLATVSAPTGNSGQLNFDQTQTSGSLGDKIQIGPITIDGPNKRIIVSDGERDRILIGFDQGGF